MTRADDYLWDPSQPPDGELAALERALAPLRHAGRPLAIDRLRRAPAPRIGRRWRWVAAIAAAAAMVVALLRWRDDVLPAELSPGAAPRTYVAGAQPIAVRLGELAAFELEPGTELAFAHWQPAEARFRLVRGAVTVRVAPPPAVAPRFLCVDTPRGSVIDLGCRYQLRVRDDGRESVRVTEGLVEFAYPTRRVLVPAGAECAIDGDWPATPLFTDRSGQLADHVGKFDAMTRQGADPELRAKVAERLAQLCESGRDTLPLWHLLRDDTPMIREIAELRLLDLEGPPPGAVAATDRKDAQPHAAAEVWLPFLRQTAWSRPR